MITFEIEENTKVIIKLDGKEIGHIFSPSGSANNNVNCIQVCGFSEAFDLWGCGIYEGFKDIQLLFDDKKMNSNFSLDGCFRCYMNPCRCENKKDNMVWVKKDMPFNIKREEDIKDRIVTNGKCSLDVEDL